MSVKETSPAEIATLYDTVAASFASRKTFPIEFRKQQLRQFWKLADENEEYLRQCLYKDLRKPLVEAQGLEIGLFKNEVVHLLDSLDDFLADETPYVPPAYQGLKPKIIKQAKGVVVVIGAWNYPFFLTVSPFLGAIAAGCTGIMKPPEQAPYTCAALAELIPKYLDTSCYALVQGAAPAVTALLSHKWNHIFYTGGGRVGKIVATAAAQQLCSYTLELGGKCPVIVTPKADLALAAKRIAWGKFSCAGQTCVAPDYALVQADIKDAFLAALQKATLDLFDGKPHEDGRMPRIVNTNHWDRVMTMVRASKGRVVVGDVATADRSDCYVPPLVLDVSQAGNQDDSLLADEIFAPVLAVTTYTTHDDAVATIQRVCPEPLGLYVMSEAQDDYDWFVDHTMSGGVSLNDTMTQIAVPNVPFGGFGASGTGAYHGKASVETFSHRRSVVTVPKEAEPSFEWRYQSGDQQLKYRQYKEMEPKL